VTAAWLDYGPGASSEGNSLGTDGNSARHGDCAMIAILAAVATALILIGLVLWWSFRRTERGDVERRRRHGWRRGVARIAPGAAVGGEADLAIGLGYGADGGYAGGCGSPGSDGGGRGGGGGGD
jgi:hypothetical protein